MNRWCSSGAQVEEWDEEVVCPKEDLVDSAVVEEEAEALAVCVVEDSEQEEWVRECRVGLKVTKE
jgi:hypothetical protein